MKPITISPRRSLIAQLALVGAAFPLLGVQVANAQDDLHPDWSRVWNQDDGQQSPGTMTVPASVIIPVTLDNPLSSSTARVGDIVTATPITREDGDSEFPPGTRIGGVVSQAQSAYKSTPGVLDIDFQSALMPDGTEVPLHGFIASLDSNAVSTQGGHIIARDGSHANAWKAIGIGGGVGFVMGRLLKTNSLVPTILGAAGAYLYARSKSSHGEDAQINAGTAFGVRLESPVEFPDPDNYASARLHYLETHRDYSSDRYGWNESIAAAPRYRYYDYDVVNTCPVWVTVSPYDYYDCPIFPVFISYRHYYRRDPRWDGRDSFWDRPAFNRGNRHDSWGWDNHNSHNGNNHPIYTGDHNSNWGDHSRTDTRDGNWNDHSARGNHSGGPITPTQSWNSRDHNTASSSGVGGEGRGNGRSWVGRPGTEPRTDSPQRNFPSGQIKTPLPPISVDAGNRSNRDRGNWSNHDSTWNTGNSSPRIDNSNRSSGISTSRTDPPTAATSSSNSRSSDRHDSFDRGWGKSDGGSRGGSISRGSSSSSGGDRSSGSSREDRTSSSSSGRSSSGGDRSSSSSSGRSSGRSGRR